MRIVTLLSFLAAGSSLSGCEAQNCTGPNGEKAVCLKSLTRFEGDRVIQSADYAPGADVTITSKNGDVTVESGDADDAVSATFQPFVLRAYDTSEDEVQADLAKLDTSIDTNADGSVSVTVARESGAYDTLGADVTVGLPPSFGGVLNVSPQNGETSVLFVGAAAGVVVHSGNGSCNVAAGSSDVSVECKNGDLVASIDAPAPQTGSGFVTDNGSITLNLPSDGVFSVEAQAADGGTVSVDGLPDACTVDAASDASQTVSCNGATSDDPIYQVTAYGTALSDVDLVF